MLPMDTTWYPVMTVEHFNTTSDQSVDGGQLTLRQGGRIIDWSFLHVTNGYNIVSGDDCGTLQHNN